MSAQKEKASFVHLHTHSHYSLLNAIPKVDELVDAALKDNQPALALTEDGNMYSAIEFYRICKKKGIKPIIGVDFFVAPRTIKDKEFRIDNMTSRLILLAKDIDGYNNLIKIVSTSYLDGFYYRPRIDKALIKKHAKGLLAILPSFSGAHAYALKDNDEVHAKEITDWYKDIFGEDFYLELTHHPEIIGHQDLQERIAQFAQKNQIPLVAAHDVYYLKKEDNIARELVRKIARAETMLGDERDLPDDFSFITQKTAQKYFKQFS